VKCLFLLPTEGKLFLLFTSLLQQLNCKNAVLLLFLYVIARCLCELARQIGFSESADDIFELQLQLSTYRHVVSFLVTTY
jgi:hypothetical protein